MKVALCIPYYGGLHARFSASVWGMVAATLSAKIVMDGRPVVPEFATFMIESGSLDFKRTFLAARARDWGARFILFMDTDHTFPADALLRLLQREKAIVGCNCPMRSDPPRPSAFKAEGERLMTTRAKAEANEVEEVYAVGLGLCLIDARILDRIPQPWFKSVFDTDRVITSEDIFFCGQARAAGFPIHVDHSLSWDLGHIAERIRRNSEFETVCPEPLAIR